jgi:hypothetical protein
MFSIKTPSTYRSTLVVLLRLKPRKVKESPRKVYQMLELVLSKVVAMKSPSMPLAWLTSIREAL